MICKNNCIIQFQNWLMNSIKAKINKLFSGLTLVGLLISLMFPLSLFANHFRYGTISWDPIADNGTHITIRVKMQNGWTANHSGFRTSDAYDTFVSGYVGSIHDDYIRIYWGDGTNETADIKIISRDNSTGTASGDCSSSDNQSSGKCIDSTISEMGEYISGTWTTGATHMYPDNGTTEYILNWGGYARTVTNNNPSDDRCCGGEWRNQTKINIAGAYDGNKSPVSAVPAVIQVQDNKTFNYQLVTTDADNDSLNYRWGKLNEFFLDPGNSGIGPSSTDNFSKPAGMTLSNSGLVEWDIKDNISSAGGEWTVDNATEGSLWTSVVMVEDLHDNGSVKSYIPLDFFFKITSASNDPPEIIGIDNTTQTVSIGTTKTFTFTSTDDSGVAPTFSVLNPPSDISSIWRTSSSTSGGTTTFTITFTPPCTFGNKSYAINIRSTDSAGMTKDQTLGLFVSTAGNADPTAPSLVSPANGSTVTKPVSFQWTKSTDADNDAISYTFYLCTDSGFAGCSGKNVSAGVNVMPPFNQNLQDSLISWPRYLEAAPIYQQISQDLSMIPRWLIMLTAFVLLSGLISFSLKNISHQKLVFMLILMIFFLSLNINSCARSDSSISETTSSSSDDNDASSTSTSATKNITNVTHTTSDVTNGATYYWKVVASDTKGGSAESATWSFTVQ